MLARAALCCSISNFWTTEILIKDEWFVCNLVCLVILGMKMPVFAHCCILNFIHVLSSMQDLTHNVPVKNESTEVVYIPVMMIITQMIAFTIVLTCLQENHHWLDLEYLCVLDYISKFQPWWTSGDTITVVMNRECGQEDGHTSFCCLSSMID